MRDNIVSREREGERNKVKRVYIALYAISSFIAGTFVSRDNAIQPACK